MLAVPDFVAAYAQTRDRLIELVRSVPRSRLTDMVPATPLWTIKDVVAHLTHVAGSYAVGHHSYSSQDVERMPIALIGDLHEIDRWAQTGVDGRRGLDVDQIIDEWVQQAAPLDRMMTGEQELPQGTAWELLSWAAVSDLATHAQDIRGALRAEPDRQAYATKIAFAGFTMMLTARGAAACVPPLRIETTRGGVSIGEGDATQVLELDWYELLRVSSGRRSASQIADLFRPVDVTPYLQIISPYPLPTEPQAA